MPFLRDLDLGSNAESRHAPSGIREENGQVNGMAGHIASTFLSALREHEFSAGKVQKIIIELRRKYQIRPDGREEIFENMINVVQYNMIFDFHKYLASSARRRGCILIEYLRDGLHKSCEILGIDSRPVDKAYSDVVADDFVYKYTHGNPTQMKRFGLKAQLVSSTAVLLPFERTRLGAEVREISSDKLFGSCVFYTDIRLHKYTGKLKWLSENSLRFEPKDINIQPVECFINKGVDFFDKVEFLSKEHQ